MSKKLITLDSMREYNQKEVAELKAEVAEVKETIVQPDWNQNDAAAADYIKNRPFYGEYENTEVVFVDNSNITDIQQNNSVAAYSFNKAFSEQDLLTVTINSETYSNLSCRLVQDNMYIYGNLSLAGLGDNTDEPFCVVINLLDKTIAVMQTISSTYDWQDFKVTKIEPGFVVKKKLDEKYLPDGLATEAYTESYVTEKISEIEIPEIPSYAQSDKISFKITYSDDYPGATPYSKSSSFNEDEIYFNHADNGAFQFNKSLSLGSESLIFQNYNGPNLGIGFVKKTTFNNGSIIYSNKESAEAEEVVTTLTFPAVSGVIATEEYVDAYVPKMLPEVTEAENTKVLQVVNGAWNVVAPTVIYVGEAMPTSDIGEDGDLYLQID